MARKLRIECEQRTRAGGVLINQRTGVQAVFYRGEAITLELGMFANRAMLVKTDFTNIKVRWKNGATLLSETIVAAASLSSSLTAQQWRQGNGALANVNFSTAATGDLPAGMLTLEVVGTMAVGGSTVFASGTVESATLDGLTTGTPPTPSPPTSYTQAEADALFEPIGTASGIADDLEDVAAFVGHTGETTDGGFLRTVAQSFTTAEKLQVRTNHGSAIDGGTHSLTGEPLAFDIDTGLNSTTLQTTPRGTKGRFFLIEPAANTEIELRAPVMTAGSIGILKIEQGFVVNWTSAYIFPPNEITFGAGSGDFAKKSWHPATGEGYEFFELISDGTNVHVRRMRKASAPLPQLDLMENGNSWDIAIGVSTGAVGGTPTTTTMAGSSFTGETYNGTSSSQSFTFNAVAVAQGMALAMVFTATNSTGQKILFASNAMGIQVVADTDGMRLQAFGGASGSGVLVATSYSSAPVAFVAVIRPGSAGAFVLTTDPTGGGQTGSFTPATPADGYVRFASESTGYTKGLACVIARCQIWRTGMNPDQARAALDALTGHYKLG